MHMKLVDQKYIYIETEICKNGDYAKILSGNQLDSRIVLMLITQL